MTAKSSFTSPLSQRASATAIHGQYDVLVVGAGVAGCAAAMAFARQSRKVLLVERSMKEPDRIVGELLQPGGVVALKQLGMEDCLLDIDAVPVKGYHVYWKGEGVTFQYPLLPFEDGQRSLIASADDRFCSALQQHRRPEGKSFHHGKFVMKLRDAVKREPNVIIFETTVTELLRDERSSHVIGVKCSGGEKHDQRFLAHLTIAADGYASIIRAQLTPQKPLAKSRFWGLELQNAKLLTYGLAYGVIGDGPPILIYQIGTDETRILIDIPNSIYERVSKQQGIKSYVQTSVIPTLPKAIQPQVEHALSTSRLRSMPNTWLPHSATKTPGLIVLGDAMNMRHPLTGGGMTVALKDVQLLSEMLDPSDVPSLSEICAVLKRMRSFFWKRKRYASSLNILAQALYTLFVAEDPQLEFMQRGFVRYIQLGPSYYEEPAGLMGGIIHNPMILFYHFFAIALYSMWLLLRQSTIWLLPVCLWRYGLVFAKAVKMILPYIISELRT